MKKILIIDGHPNENSLCYALAEAYRVGALKQGAEVKKLRIADLDFNPNLRFGYQKRTELEPDLLEAFDLLQWADHWVWVHPVWWSGIPALMKGFIDRLFLPGFTYEPIIGSLRVKPLMKGKTAHIIATLDQPSWYYRLFSKAPSEYQMKESLKLCGVKPIRMTYIGIVKDASAIQREKWLDKARNLGEKQL